MFNKVTDKAVNATVESVKKKANEEWLSNKKLILAGIGALLLIKLIDVANKQPQTIVYIVKGV